MELFSYLYLHDLKEVGLGQVRGIPRAHVLGIGDAPPCVVCDVVSFGELLMSSRESVSG